MTPAYRVTCDGADISKAVASRLLSLRILDEAGFKNDRMELVLDNAPPFIADPPPSARFEVFLGYKETGLRQMGVYELGEIANQGPPHTVTYVCHAKSQASGIKGSRQRSWHNKTLGEIVKEIAGLNSLGAKIDSSLESIKVPHIEQSAQSDMGFLTDLARNNNAVMKIANGSVYFAPYGSAKNLDGSGTVESVAIDFTKVGQYRRLMQVRGFYNGVRGLYWDRKEAKQKYAQAGGNKSSTSVYILPEIYNDKDAARRAALSIYRTTLGSVNTLSLAMPGNPDIMAETKITLMGEFPTTIPRSGWSCDRVEHAVAGNGGYTTTLELSGPGISKDFAKDLTSADDASTYGALDPSLGDGVTYSDGSEAETNSSPDNSGDQEEPRDNKEGTGNDGYTVTESLDDVEMEDAP